MDSTGVLTPDLTGWAQNDTCYFFRSLQAARARHFRHSERSEESLFDWPSNTSLMREGDRHRRMRFKSAGFRDSGLSASARRRRGEVIRHRDSFRLGDHPRRTSTFQTNLLSDNDSSTRFSPALLQLREGGDCDNFAVKNLWEQRPSRDNNFTEQAGIVHFGNPGRNSHTGSEPLISRRIRSCGAETVLADDDPIPGGLVIELAN